MAATTTLAMIVRNEGANLPACLESVKGLVDELVIVDTGSADGTIKVARGFGARVFKFDWCDDFSAARNFGLDRVRTDFVFRMDADDRLMPGHRRRLSGLLKSLSTDHPVAWSCRVHSTEEAGRRRSYSDEWRLWPHGPAPSHRFTGAVHERIKIEEWGVDMRRSDVAIEHVGYASDAEVRRKQLRNLAILEREIRVVPCDPFVVFDYARTCVGLGHASLARDAFRGFLRTRDVRYDMAGRIAYRMLADVETDLSADDPRVALEVCREGLGHYPDDAPLTLKVAGLLASVGLVDEAREGLLMALALHRPNRMDSGVAADFKQRIEAALAALEDTAAA